MSIGLLYMQRNETQIHVYIHAFGYTFSRTFAWIQILTYVRTFTQARTHTRVHLYRRAWYILRRCSRITMIYWFELIEIHRRLWGSLVLLFLQIVFVEARAFCEHVMTFRWVWRIRCDFCRQYQAIQCQASAMIIYGWKWQAKPLCLHALRSSRSVLRSSATSLSTPLSDAHTPRTYRVVHIYHLIFAHLPLNICTS